MTLIVQILIHPVLAENCINYTFQSANSTRSGLIIRTEDTNKETDFFSLKSD